MSIRRCYDSYIEEIADDFTSELQRMECGNESDADDELENALQAAMDDFEREMRQALEEAKDGHLETPCDECNDGACKDCDGDGACKTVVLVNGGIEAHPDNCEECVDRVCKFCDGEGKCKACGGSGYKYNEGRDDN